ncbi:MAG: hypothetical protein OEV43_04470, partial [Coriobacteriia bacterium]|nr:hypothetical protein [Coriobacteriia bacterium]
YSKIGPLALRCMSCHQVHNATDQVWTTAEVYDWYGLHRTPNVSYKLLKAFPSGTTTGAPNSYGYYDAWQAVRVPETTLTPDVNFSTEVGAGFVVAATGRAAPNWVAQDFNGGVPIVDAPYVNQPGWGSWEECLKCHGSIWGSGVNDILFNVDSPIQRSSAISNMALSVWCADCHNLNIGYSKRLDNPELGFKAHTERTHPVPMVGGHEGPGQCYTCHRGDLSPTNSACGQCHYGTGDYWEQRVNPGSPNHVDADFPHSGDTDSIKLLGSYSVVGFTGSNQGTVETSTVITEDNLDAVCTRCHGGIGVYH